MPYTIEDHNHRLSAWAAGRAASVKGCRFRVHVGVAILEASGFNAVFFTLNHLPLPANSDATHPDWRMRVTAEAKNQGTDFKHGVAARLINCYLKVRFVCAGKHGHPCVDALHPPIDEVPLKELATINLGGNSRHWPQCRQTRWSKFDSTTYQRVIDLIWQSQPSGEPRWKVEEHWSGHQ